MRRTRPERGFTLIEMLVVFVVIALLAPAVGLFAHRLRSHTRTVELGMVAQRDARVAMRAIGADLRAGAPMPASDAQTLVIARPDESITYAVVDIDGVPTLVRDRRAGDDRSRVALISDVAGLAFEYRDLADHRPPAQARFVAVDVNIARRIGDLWLSRSYRASLAIRGVRP